MKLPLRNLVLLIALAICCQSCFRRWVMSDKQIAAYYRNKPVKPVFFTITNDSVSMFCATTGSDTLPPLIMIHGAPGAWYGSRNLLDDPQLQKEFHLIAVDRLGYNKSRYRGKRKAVPSIDVQAEAIHEVLRLNKSKKTGVVMGSSYGAPIAANIAIKYPLQFHHVMMLAPAIDPSLEKFWWFHRYLQSGILVRLLPRYIRNATEEKFAHVGELQKLDARWSGLNVSVSVMQGGRDYIIEPANLDYARKVLSGKEATFIYLPEASHIIRWHYVDTIKAVLRRANEDLRPAPAIEQMQVGQPVNDR